MVDLEPLGLHRDSCDYCDESIKMYDCAVNGVPMCLNHLSGSNNPYICDPQGMGRLQNLQSNGRDGQVLHVTKPGADKTNLKGGHWVWE